MAALSLVLITLQLTTDSFFKWLDDFLDFMLWTDLVRFGDLLLPLDSDLLIVRLFNFELFRFCFGSTCVYITIGSKVLKILLISSAGRSLAFEVPYCLRTSFLTMLFFWRVLSARLYLSQNSYSNESLEYLYGSKYSLFVWYYRFSYSLTVTWAPCMLCDGVVI